MPATDESRTINQPGPHFIVVVPGYMGSLLRDKVTGKIIWLDVPSLLGDLAHIKQNVNELLEKMCYPNENLEPAGLMDKLLFAPPFFKQEHYGRLLEKLMELGYEIDPPDPNPDTLAAYTFPYDWRQDNRISAQQLGQAVKKWRAVHNDAKAWLIGHSNGGIVSRWYIEKEGGKEHVERLFLMGSPWDGAPKAIKMMFTGLTVLGNRKLNLFNLNTRLKDVIRSFPSFYQLIPTVNPFLEDDHNRALDLFGQPAWLEEKYRGDLEKALDFNHQLGDTLSVDTVCFFGRMKPTVTSGRAVLDAAGMMKDIEWMLTESGDGTVPERSAVHPHARAKYAFAVTHGNIYVDPQVLPQLEWELIGKYRLGMELAHVSSDILTVTFDASEDVYAPGETIDFWAEVASTNTGKPAADARISVKLLWRQSLDGDEAHASPESMVQTIMEPDPAQPGRYTGNLVAPQAEGYYNLQAEVSALDETVMLEELVLIEAEPAVEEILAAAAEEE
jgi:hypothetical protein